jgi:hypothetical protein
MIKTASLISIQLITTDNFLYKGNGDGSFTKLLPGAIVNDGGNSLNCAWEIMITTDILMYL